MVLLEKLFIKTFQILLNVTGSIALKDSSKINMSNSTALINSLANSISCLSPPERVLKFTSS